MCSRKSSGNLDTRWNLSENEEKKPNPGSKEAVEMGCRCPVMDNGYGRGYHVNEDGPLFWITLTCPLHGKENDKHEAD